MRDRRHSLLRQDQDRDQPLHRQSGRRRPLLPGRPAVPRHHVDPGALGVRLRAVSAVLRVDVDQLVRVGVRADGDEHGSLPGCLLADRVDALPHASGGPRRLRLRLAGVDALHAARPARRNDGGASGHRRPPDVHDALAARRTHLAGEGVHLVRLPARFRRPGRAHFRLLRPRGASSAPHRRQSQDQRANQVARSRHCARSDSHRRLRLLLAAILDTAGY